MTEIDRSAIVYILKAKTEADEESGEGTVVEGQAETISEEDKEAG